MFNLPWAIKAVYLSGLRTLGITLCDASSFTLYVIVIRVISVLRKMCNHPDLLLLSGAAGKKKTLPPNVPDYGCVERSGKLKVLQSVLKMWKEQGHRALVFAQTRQTLDILANFALEEGYAYRRLDGTTSIRNRMPLIDEFNDDSSIFLMLLTTKTGGLGINLVGANRVLLFDPDWNPSTDSQAKERAYRIGQSKDVTVYRLITRVCPSSTTFAEM
jgi:DNA excision repair protein ERCC-6